MLGYKLTLTTSTNYQNVNCFQSTGFGAGAGKQDGGEGAFCRRITVEDYEEEGQRLMRASLTHLLDTIINDVNMNAKNKKKRLKQVRFYLLLLPTSNSTVNLFVVHAFAFSFESRTLTSTSVAFQLRHQSQARANQISSLVCDFSATDRKARHASFVLSFASKACDCDDHTRVQNVFYSIYTSLISLFSAYSFFFFFSFRRYRMFCEYVA